MLAHVLYTSRRKPNCNDAEIDKILQACINNNPSIHITGVLLYSNDKFIQYVEGEYDVLMQLYDKIKLDTRHDNVRLITMGPITEKIFPSWHMGSKKMSFDNIEYQSNISAAEKKVFADILSGTSSKPDMVISLIKKLF